MGRTSASWWPTSNIAMATWGERRARLSLGTTEHSHALWLCARRSICSLFARWLVESALERGESSTHGAAATTGRRSVRSVQLYVCIGAAIMYLRGTPQLTPSPSRNSNNVSYPLRLYLPTKDGKRGPRWRLRRLVDLKVKVYMCLGSLSPFPNCTLQDE